LSGHAQQGHSANGETEQRLYGLEAWRETPPKISLIHLTLAIVAKRLEPAERRCAHRTWRLRAPQPRDVAGRERIARVAYLP